MGSVILENLYLDPYNMVVKFSSPTIMSFRAAKNERCKFVGMGLNCGKGKEVTRLDIKQLDIYCIARTFYFMAKVVNCKDPMLGKILKTLMTSNDANLGLLKERFDEEILGNDPLFYYKLSV